MGHGRVFALYVLLYCVGRLWIESLRIDSANTVLGLRLNIWTSIAVGLGALAYLVISSRMRPGREVIVFSVPEPVAATQSDDQDPKEAGPDVADADTPDPDETAKNTVT
jgi:hypothetical protein